MTGIGTVLTILYTLGAAPWTLTHARVYHGTTKTFTQTCWSAEERNTILTWDKNQTEPEQPGNSSRWIQEQIRNRLAETENLTDGTWAMTDQQYVPNYGWVITYLTLGREQRRAAQCNWIHPEHGTPAWYCTWGCTPLPGNTTKAYWEKEVVYDATPRNNTCLAILPKDKFWGNYKLQCGSEKPRSQRRRVKVPPRRVRSTTSTAVTHTGNSDTATPEDPGKTNFSSTTTQPITQLPTPTPGLENPDFQPQDSLRRNRSRELAHECFHTKLRTLSPCFWNIQVACRTQPYMVITRAEAPRYSPFRNMYWMEPLYYYEEWLNLSLPWIWAVPLQHHVANFQEGYARTSHGLDGPYKTLMYVQKLPTPTDLMTVPQEDFNNIDICVVGKILNSLDGRDYTSDGKSPRCTLKQIQVFGWGIWKYNCSRLMRQGTTKSVLQS